MRWVIVVLAVASTTACELAPRDPSTPSVGWAWCGGERAAKEWCTGSRYFPGFHELNPELEVPDVVLRPFVLRYEADAVRIMSTWLGGLGFLFEPANVLIGNRLPLATAPLPGPHLSFTCTEVACRHLSIERGADERPVHMASFDLDLALPVNGRPYGIATVTIHEVRFRRLDTRTTAEPLGEITLGPSTANTWYRVEGCEGSGGPLCSGFVPTATPLPVLTTADLEACDILFGCSDF